MAETFVTNGTGSQQTLSPIQEEKIPVYASLSDAVADLANLNENQIVATKDLGGDLAQPVDVIQSGNMHAVTSNAVAGALSSKLSVVEVSKGVGYFQTITDILNFFASNEGRALVPEGGARLVKLGFTDDGGWHNVYIGTTNSTYFTITIFSFYFPLQSWIYSQGTWGRHDDTVDIVTGSTLVGGGSYKLKRCGKVVTLDIWGCSIDSSVGDVLFLTLPEGYRPSEAIRVVGNYGSSSLSSGDTTIFSIRSSGSVEAYTYSSFDSLGEQLHAVWVLD